MDGVWVDGVKQHAVFGFRWDMDPAKNFSMLLTDDPDTDRVRTSLTVEDCAPYVFVTNVKRADNHNHQTRSALHGQCNSEFIVRHHINMNKTVQSDADSWIMLNMMDCHASFLVWSLPYFDKRLLPEDPEVAENMFVPSPIMPNWNWGGGCAISARGMVVMIL